MTPADFREAREALGLSQAGLAELWGIDARTVRKWELSERAVNPVAAFCIRLMVEMKGEE